MISFPHKLDSKIVLSNANTLLHQWNWDETSPMPHLTINETGEISIVRKSRENVRLDDFEDDKSILRWHWSMLKPLIKQKIDILNYLTSMRLDNYYQQWKSTQGYVLLCEHMEKMLIKLYKAIFDEEMKVFFEKQVQIKAPSTQRVIEILSEVAKPMMDAEKERFIVFSKKIISLHQKLLHAQKKLGADSIFSSYFSTEGPPKTEVEVIPFAYPLGQFKYQGINSNVMANFSTGYNDNELNKSFVSDGITVKLLQNSPVAIIAYPGWLSTTEKQYRDLTLLELGMTTYGQSQKLQSECAKKSLSLGYHSADLMVGLIGDALNFDDESLVAHLQCAIELCSVHGYQQVCMYAPYSFSAKLFTLGFEVVDAEEPSQETLKKYIEVCATNNKAAEFMLEKTKYNATGQQLLRPHIFRFKDMQKDFPLLSTGMSSYAQLIKAQAIVDEVHYDKKILPDFYQPPFQPYYTSFKALKNREITGKLQQKKKVIRLEEVDYCCLLDDKDLEGIGNASTALTPAKGDNKKIARLTVI